MNSCHDTDQSDKQVKGSVKVSRGKKSGKCLESEESQKEENDFILFPLHCIASRRRRDEEMKNQNVKV